MKEILLTIIITIGFIHAEDWIYFNNITDYEYNYGVPDVVYSVSRISPDGEISETILDDVQYSDISEDGTIEDISWDIVEPVSFSIYNTETSETISSITGINPVYARFTHDENIVLYMEGYATNWQLYKLGKSKYSLHSSINFSLLLCSSLI